jgi:dynein heavy chain, axonemal
VWPSPNKLELVSLPQVLEQAKSSYLSPFLNLRNLIQREAIAAEDNVKFLLVMEEPCEALAKATPDQIPGTLLKILNCIRLIWNLSRFYNTPDRITALLRKVCRLCSYLRCPENPALQHRCV